MSEQISPEIEREMGKALFFRNIEDPENRRKGLELLIAAKNHNDPEAEYIIAKLILEGFLKTTNSDSVEHALALMCHSANNGYIQSRSYLNAYCSSRYVTEFGKTEDNNKKDGKLVDFKGKPIHINRQGILTPIDAVLEYKDGQNVLTLSTNVYFCYCEPISEYKLFEQAVLDGFCKWGGEYTVFGGQKLVVKIELTTEDRIFDSTVVVPTGKEIRSAINKASKVLTSKEKKESFSSIVSDKRSFASTGIKWSASSRKMVFMQLDNDSAFDYEETMHVAKHEFGHALGLGDLYPSETDCLIGVDKGTFAELDSYIICDKFYNLVMCDHHGPISNNDIEMVVLAFRENKQQLYQPKKTKDRVSVALGRGN